LDETESLLDETPRSNRKTATMPCERSQLRTSNNTQDSCQREEGLFDVVFETLGEEVAISSK